MKTNKNLFIALAVILIVFVVLMADIRTTNRGFENLDLSLKVKTTKTYRIGFITDIHGKKTSKNEFGLNDKYRRTIESFVNQMNNNFHPRFVVQGGDFIDGTKRKGKKSIDDFTTINSYYSKVNVPGYHMVGNHDMRGLTSKEWLNLTGNESTYYYFDHEEMRIIVLNGQEDEKIDVRPPFLSDTQFTWLENTLRDSTSFRNIIVFSHYPPTSAAILAEGKIVYPENAGRVIDLFSKYGVSAVISGHTEKLDFTEIEGVRYFTIPGLFRSENKIIPWYDVFSEIYVKNRVKIKMFYKKNREGEGEYESLNIPSEEYEAIEK